MTETPLTWPDHDPPRSRWKKFFIGVRILGPDRLFFAELKRLQARRTAEVMESWANDAEKRLALAIGDTISATHGWMKPYFVPGDCFAVILNGPRYDPVDYGDRDAATEEIQSKLNRVFPDEFRMAPMQKTLGEVVREMTAGLAPTSVSSVPLW